jgi:hypothetical protein
MVKTTIYLPDELHQGIKQAAKERGTSEAELIRTAVRHELLGAPVEQQERAKRRARACSRRLASSTAPPTPWLSRRAPHRVAQPIVLDASVAIAALAADEAHHDAAVDALASASDDEFVLAATTCTSASRFRSPSLPGRKLIFARVRCPSQDMNQSGRTVRVGFLMRFFACLLRICDGHTAPRPGTALGQAGCMPS